MKKMYKILFVFFILFTGTGKIDSFGKYLSLISFYKYLDINKLNFNEFEESMSNEDEKLYIKNEFSNNFLLILNSILIFLLIFLTYGFYVMYMKSKLVLSTQFQDFSLFDNKYNCLYTISKQDKNGNILSSSEYCDISGNSVIDTTLHYDKEDNLEIIFFDDNENGKDDRYKYFDKFDRYEEVCTYDEKFYRINKCTKLFKNKQKVESNFFLEKNSQKIESHEFYDNKGNFQFKYSIYGDKGIKVENKDDE